MILLAKSIVILFGLFLIAVGLLMLIKPSEARAILRKAGSTAFINYAEISLRMIPATALVVYADYCKYPDFFSLLGWFMIATSLILYFVPRRLHHQYALFSAKLLKPNLIRYISPFSIIFGLVVIYNAL